MTTKEKILKQFEEEFGFLTRVIKGNPFSGITETENVKSFLSSALDTYGKETEKAFGGCKLCYGKGYASVRIGTSSRRHAEIHEEMHFCSCSRGKDLKGKFDTYGKEQYDEAFRVSQKLKTEWEATARAQALDEAIAAVEKEWDTWDESKKEARLAIANVLSTLNALRKK